MRYIHRAVHRDQRHLTGPELAVLAAGRADWFTSPARCPLCSATLSALISRANKTLYALACRSCPPDPFNEPKP